MLGLAQLQGCGTQEEEPLTLWMQRERELIKPNVTPSPEPTRFEPYQYTSEALVEPFSKEKLAGILRTGQSANQRSALIDAELQRNISMAYYDSGHMMYIHPPSLAQLKQDLAEFMDATLDTAGAN